MTTGGSTGVFSGSGGFAQVGTALLARLMMWRFNPTREDDAWGDSDSAGYTNHKGARKDGSGTITGKLDKTAEQFDVLTIDDSVTLVLWMDGDETTPSVYWYIGCANITSFELELDQDGKTAVGFTADFVADGPFFRPGQTGAPTVSFPT